MAGVRILEVKKSIYENNDAEAERLRKELAREGRFLVNLMSSPGSGKTSVVMRLIEVLSGEMKIGVMEADIDSSVDAETVFAAGVAAVQIHTDGMCHLDAGMTRKGLESPEMCGKDLVILENVGNLVCPAEFDTGAHVNIMILSVPEGDDKPLKYPLMFTVCDLLIINKTDTLGVFDFDTAAAAERARALNPTIDVICASAKTGVGMEDVADWVRAAACSSRYHTLADDNTKNLTECDGL
ncbi:MAG: hydrogenase nickel incorporation protein HypB [Clostridiales Family XIII bacterium]|jgi:hydrogenase nickel incorporation protein HypB|nr:hydrogenase nickel incorporation protein HypB [Clostridiales Family XIII bacterium]